MAQRTSSFWIWTLIVALTAQLTIAFGHIHSPSSPTHAPLPLHDSDGIHQDSGCDDAPVPGSASNACGAEVHTSGAKGHIPSIGTGTPAPDAIGERHQHDGPSDHCELCWIIATLSFVALPLLAYLLLGLLIARQLACTSLPSLVGATAWDTYRARAPPLISRS